MSLLEETLTPVQAIRRRRSWSIALAVGRTALGAALFVVVLRSGAAWGPLRELLTTAWLVGLINVVPLVGAAIEAGRLRLLFAAQALDVSFGTGFRVVAIGSLFNLWIPGGTGGDVMKLYYLSRLHRGRLVQLATILFVDRLVAFCALLGLIAALLAASSSMLSSVFLGRIAGVLALAVLGLGAGVALAWSPWVRETRIYRAITGPWLLGRFVAHAADAFYAFRHRRRALLLAALYSLAGHILLAAVLAVAGTVLVPDASPVLVATLALLGLIANVVPVTPGGVGVGEAASEALFRSVGIVGGSALVAAWRAGMIGVCLIGTAFYIRGERTEARSQ